MSHQILGNQRKEERLKKKEVFGFPFLFPLSSFLLLL